MQHIPLNDLIQQNSRLSISGLSNMSGSYLEQMGKCQNEEAQILKEIQELAKAEGEQFEQLPGYNQLGLQKMGDSM